MQPIIDLVREQPFSEGLTESQVELLASCASDVVVTGNTWLTREGEAADYFYLIRCGTVALEMYIPGRENLTFMTLKAGDLLGVNWIVPPYRNVFDARTLEPVNVLKFNAGFLRYTCDTDHEFGYLMMKRYLPPLVERLRTTRFQCAQLYDEQRKVQQGQFAW